MSATASTPLPLKGALIRVYEVRLRHSGSHRTALLPGPSVLDYVLVQSMRLLATGHQQEQVRVESCLFSQKIFDFRDGKYLKESPTCQAGDTFLILRV